MRTRLVVLATLLCTVIAVGLPKMAEAAPVAQPWPDHFRYAEPHPCRPRGLHLRPIEHRRQLGPEDQALPPCQSRRRASVLSRRQPPTRLAFMTSPAPKVS